MLFAAQYATADTGDVDVSVAGITAAFERDVDKRLNVPPEEQTAYAGRLEAELARAGLADLVAQYFVVVDRSPVVQAILVYWRSAHGTWYFVGASPVSTGRPGGFEHFLTPVGVFEHSLANPDFRAEGTFNDLGIRGYGLKGMRVFDFGWVTAERGWGPGGKSPMRLQMHATDPVLEKFLGQAHSKGCIRIPATLDRFLDRYGILDANYERAASLGAPPGVLLRNREPAPWPGRYLVVVDSQRTSRPAWSRSGTPGKTAAAPASCCRRRAQTPDRRARRARKRPRACASRKPAPLFDPDQNLLPRFRDDG
jgi:hypothetical protein